MAPCSSTTRRFAGLAMLLALTSAPSARAGENAAHALAEKFSGAVSHAPTARDLERRKAEEAEMLERARQEAAARAEAEAQVVRDAERRRKDMEAARAAEADRLAEKLQRAEEARRLKAAGTGRVPADPAASAPGGDVATDVGATEEPAPAPNAEEEVRPSLTPPMALGGTERIPAVPEDPRVTVLLVMEPGNKGIRRFNKTADPVLCHGAQCFVSTGAATPARALPRGRALGAANTFGQRAGACRHSLTCVFRAVTLDGAAPSIQPIDLKVLVHDRRAPRTVSGDTSCRVTVGRLSCSRTVVAPGYRAWIIPERIAEEAGAGVLGAALARGLVTTPLREAALRD